jgi:hypothetical protein
MALVNDDPCPVSGRPADPEHWILSQGKKVVFCCADCPKEYILKHDNRLSDEEKKDGWKLLFDGKGLEGFQKPTREGKWEALDGVLTGKGGAGVLATEASYDDFVLIADARVRDLKGERRGNSGIFIRSSGLTAQNGRWPDGHEVQIDHGDPEYWTGALFKTAKAKKLETKDGEWLSLRVEASGQRIRVWVNGALVTEHEEKAPSVKGPISLQVHHPSGLVEFKNLKLKPLRGA